jgi:hypothetical protein
MDTTTVLEIIEMIKTRYEAYDDLYENMKSLPLSVNGMQSAKYACKCNALHELINHLESYIEAQLSAAENSTGE